MPPWTFVIDQEFESAALTVTETHVVSWAGLTGDWVALHTDAEAAAQSAFGERVAHGPLTLALALGLVTQCGVFTGNVVAWLGLDGVRASAPVRFGDTIRARVRVAELRPAARGERDVCRLHYSVVNQREEEVMTFDNTLLLNRAAA
ncbi:Bifunctional protein PaaZ [Baekduia alba]|uniref:MaoC/PaaZ C-terminal domain-containing protein n=1 Tax=Baekduia alba TaxID=2997333 RepID=UPI0023400F6A|nr:MaoC/PaaZ C-terminal domain-containing protein [Baekduia alba]WCB95378.1 Bifunctional protein PaaZ [Baekduia alba]